MNTKKYTLIPNTSSECKLSSFQDTEPLTQNAVPTGRTTPRLAPPKKEPNATKQVSRFGFRHGPVNRLNKVADLNNQPVTAEFGNNNGVVVGGGTTKRSPGVAKSVGLADSNRNRTAKSGINVQPQVSCQSTCIHNGSCC